MNKLFYRNGYVYSIGGYGSGGVNYFRKLQDGSEWTEFERTHTSLNLRDESEIELANNSAIYFN